MRSAEELRAESRRLRETIKTISNPVLKQQLASQALDLAMRAEAIADSSQNLEILRSNIERYRRMLLAGNGTSEAQKQTIEKMLRDAEEILRNEKRGLLIPSLRLEVYNCLRRFNSSKPIVTKVSHSKR